MVNVSRTFFQDSRIKTIVYETVCGNIPLNSTEIRKQTYQPLNRGFPLLSITTVIFRKTVSFERGKVIKKDIFPSCHSVRQRKTSLSPHQESNLRPSDSALRCSTTEPQRLHGKRGLLRSSYDTRVFVNCLPTQEKCYRCPVL